MVPKQQKSRPKRAAIILPESTKSLDFQGSSVLEHMRFELTASTMRMSFFTFGVL